MKKLAKKLAVMSLLCSTTVLGPSVGYGIAMLENFKEIDKPKDDLMRLKVNDNIPLYITFSSGLDLDQLDLQIIGGEVDTEFAPPDYRDALFYTYTNPNMVLSLTIYDKHMLIPLADFAEVFLLPHTSKEDRVVQIDLDEKDDFYIFKAGLWSHFAPMVYNLKISSWLVSKESGS